MHYINIHLYQNLFVINYTSPLPKKAFYTTGILDLIYSDRSSVYGVLSSSFWQMNVLIVLIHWVRKYLPFVSSLHWDTSASRGSK